MVRVRWLIPQFNVSALCLVSSICLGVILLLPLILSFFFNDTATTEIYTLSLHDALPISVVGVTLISSRAANVLARPMVALGARLLPTGRNISSTGSLLLGIATGLLWTPCAGPILGLVRSEEHTSELQSLRHIPCRLLLGK